MTAPPADQPRSGRSVRRAGRSRRPGTRHLHEFVLELGRALSLAGTAVSETQDRLLVPGAVGLIGVTEVVGDPVSAGVGDLVQPLASIMAIALGVLCGVAVDGGLTSTAERLPQHRRARRTAHRG